MILFSCAKNNGIVSITSPDGKVSVVFKIKKDDQNSAYYSIKRANDIIIEDSKLGLQCGNDVSFDKNFAIISVRKHKVNQSWQPVYGERTEIPDRYEEAIILLRQSLPPMYLLTVTFRAYNEGIAFRYTIPEQQHLKNVFIEREESEFSFGGDVKTWAVYSAQAKYEEVTISQVQPGCERSLTIKIKDSFYVAIGEANLVDYARMKFDPKVDKPNTLVSSLAGEVRGDLPLSTPWRFVMVGRSPGDLLEKNYLLLNLNESCKIKDTSWIKPGKIIREVTLTTQGGKACVDFAVKHNLQYVEFDAGWYGHEYDDSSDATIITVDQKRSPGPLDLHEVIRYANERDIGIILYVNRRALEKQLDEILPLYMSWGIKGVKYGFVNVGSQFWTS